LQQLLRRQNQDRISLVDVMTHPWVKEGMAKRAAQLEQKNLERGKENLAKN